MRIEGDFSIIQRLRDAFYKVDSNPAHIKQVLHSRGCSRSRPLEVMPDDSSDTYPFFVAQLGRRGGVIMQCPECQAKRELLE